jgi:hypothetical protein
LGLDLSGKVLEKLYPTQAKVSGTINFKTGNYKINVSASNANVEKWGNYAVPLEPLNFQGGEADVSLEFSPPKTKGWPFSLIGEFSFTNAIGKFDKYKIEKTRGKLFMADESLAFRDFNGRINDIPLKTSGRLFNFIKQNLDFVATIRESELKNLAALFPQIEDLDIQGSGEAELTIQGTIPAPIVSGTINVKAGRFYNQAFSGESLFSFKQDILDVNVTDLLLYKGKIFGKCKVDFSKKIPELTLAADLRKIDLVTLSQNAPGIVGDLDGEMNLSGPMSNLKGDLSASLRDASFFGQPKDKLTSSFRVRDGDIYLESFSATSKASSIISSGKISRDLNFDFQAKAQGIRLSGEGIFGEMEATVNSFQGDISWKLDKKFFASPLKNLTASGQIKLSEGKVGDQLFDLAQGNFTVGKGLISIQDVSLQRKLSVLRASGQTGIGFPTSLNIAGENINLEDLKILNYLLPKEAKDPKGYANINIEITGELSKDTQIASFDPLLDLNARGEIDFTNLKAAEVPKAKGILKFQWQDRNLNFSECSFKTPGSDVSFDMFYGKDDQIKGKAQGIVDFSEFKKFTAKYGKINGKLGINLAAQGNFTDPDLAASFWLLDPRFNNIDFDKIEGSFVYFRNKLSFPKPLLLSNGKSQYELSGNLNLTELDLNFKIVRSDLSSFVNLSRNIQAEFSRRLYSPTAEKKSKINLSSLVLPTPRQFTQEEIINLYGHNGERKYFLKSWQNMLKDVEKAIAAAPEENLGGKLTGNFYLKGKFNDLAGKFTGEVKDGFFRNFTFKRLGAEALLAHKKIKINKFELSKERGIFSFLGEIGFDGNIDLNLSARRMPLDTLKILFDKEFKGTFDLNASLEGPFLNPKISAEAMGSNVTLAGLPFTQISFAVSKFNSTIFIHDFSLLEGKHLSSISGSIPLTSTGKIDLKADLKENALGLFNLLTNEVNWKKGSSAASINIGGTPEQPDINGNISLKNTSVRVKALNSEIKDIKGEAKIENNQMRIESLTGYWKGKSSRNYPNPLGLAGTIDLRRLFSKKRMVDLNLILSPTNIYADFPNLYVGQIKIKRAELSGPYYFDFSKGPTLRGEADINNAVITLSQANGREEKALPLNFDLSVDLSKNVYAVMGDIATFDLSNIFMNLELQSKKLKISGSYAYPSLLGNIFLKRGTVTIFNREFSLLSSEEQNKYYPYDADKIRDNFARFTGEKGREGIMPNVTITAQVDVDTFEEDVSGKLAKKKVIILSHLQGVVGSTEKQRGLEVSFDSFTEDKTKTPYEIIPAGHSEQDIKVMLLPDFIKSLAGIEDTKADTNVVLADYINSRFQTFVFRGIERELEQRFGLESLTLEYNIGKDVRQAMGVEEERGFEEEKPDWRVGFVKGFFDKLYVDVRYTQATEETAGEKRTYFNYQLTYKLSPIWSIIYYHEPTSLLEPSTSYQKMTLKAGFSFW